MSPATAEGIDARLYHVWRLLSAATNHDSRYAIDSVAPLEPMLGAELAVEVRDALIACWRAWAPRLKSERGPGEQNFSYAHDCMGIAGITLEAARDHGWAQHLSPAEARVATRYATLELNGFPSWLVDLAAAARTGGPPRHSSTGAPEGASEGGKIRTMRESSRHSNRWCKGCGRLQSRSRVGGQMRRNQKSRLSMSPVVRGL